MIECLAAAFNDRRYPSYTDHRLATLFAQRSHQIACAYAGGNDANTLHRDPMFKSALEQRPLDEEVNLASAATFSRLDSTATP